MEVSATRLKTVSALGRVASALSSFNADPALLYN